MNTEQLIIDNSQAQGTWRMLSQGMTTLMFWALWCYLAMPVFYSVFVAFGLSQPTDRTVDPGIVLGLFTTIAIVSGGIVLWNSLWTVYDHLRHRFSHRQRFLIYLRAADLAEYFNVSPIEVAAWQHTDQLVIEMTKEGSICDVRSADAQLYDTSGSELARMFYDNLDNLSWYDIGVTSTSCSTTDPWC